MSNANHRRPKRLPRRTEPTAEVAAQREIRVAEEALHRLSTAEPLDVDGTRTVGIGVGVWVVAGLVLLLGYRDDLVAAGNEWWLWSCLAGVGLGLLGWAYCRRRRDRARAGAGTGVGRRREL